MENQKIVVRCILDILGAPKEFIEMKLKEHINKLKEDKLEILCEEVAEAKQQNELFTTFAELEIKFKNPQELLDFCFDSMPSSIEIIEPEHIELQTAHLSDLLNDFQNKLHHTDSMLRRIELEKKNLDLNAMNVFRNFIKYALEHGPQTQEELSKIIGVKPDLLTPFLQQIEKKEKIKKEGDTWSLKGQ